METGIGSEFIRRTQHAYLEVSDQQKGLPPPPLVSPAEDGVERIELPAPDTVGLEPVDFRALVTRRSSLRKYARTPLGLEELSLLLWCTQGVKEVYAPGATMRTVPSAGARHAFETFLLVHRVDGLEPGLYRYDALGHQLLLLDAPADLDQRVLAACYGQHFVKTSAVTFLWVAVPYRMNWRYGQRGYRYLYLDAGHVCQNLYLAAEAVGAGACAVGAFDDEALDAHLKLDGQSQFVIYLAAVGKRPASQ